MLEPVQVDVDAHEVNAPVVKSYPCVASVTSVTRRSRIMSTARIDLERCIERDFALALPRKRR